MNSEEIFKLYEKLYFHEVEAREKIAGRLQIPLAILLSITSLLAIFMKGSSFTVLSGWNLVFLLLLTMSILLFCLSLYFFIRAFFGHSYEFIPSAVDSENYRKELIETYKAYDGCENLVAEYFKAYLYKYFSECATVNTIANDQRSNLIHKCNTFFVANLVPLLLTFLVFTLADIDKNSAEKTYKIIIDEPVQIDSTSTNKDLGMTQQKLPTPPPPPPKRVIKEDVKIPFKQSPPTPDNTKGD